MLKLETYNSSNEVELHLHFYKIKINKKHSKITK